MSKDLNRVRGKDLERTYGAVYEVSVRGVPYIAKWLHDNFVNQEVSRRERTAIQQTFRQECVTLSKLKHPNIVHFVGVHYGRAPGDVSLIMEKLHTDLRRCLDTKPNIPLPIKLSFILDVSYGLLYLNTLSPKPIIHRDLTASNILLTSDMRAKIGDLGVSKILDLRAQVARTQTKAPGALYYMPPEALSASPQYGVELDIFSFGHLALYTITQVFPEPDDTKVTPTAVECGEMQLAKRTASINKMGRDHCLYPLIIQCPKDRPERRPTTSDLTQDVKELSIRKPVNLTHEMVINSRSIVSNYIPYHTVQDLLYQEMKAENPKLLQQMEKLSGSNAELQIKIDEQQDQISLMTKLKEDLINDLEAARAEVKKFMFL